MSARDKAVEALQLAVSESRLNVGHPVVVAELKLLVIPGTLWLILHLSRVSRDAMAAQQLQPLVQGGRAGQNHSTFSGGNKLDRMKAEHGHFGIPAAADRLALVRSADRVGCILHHVETVPLSKARDGPQVTGLAREVDRHHHLRELAASGRSLKLAGQRAR